MAHKKMHSPPVPPDNLPQAGPPGAADVSGPQSVTGSEVASSQAQDPKRRLGNFEGAGEHARQQPSPLNDGTHHSK